MKLDKSKEMLKQDFPRVIDALIMIEDWGFDLNEHLYELLIYGFIKDMKDASNQRMVMLLGVLDDGSEEMISHPAVADKMGSIGLPPVTMLVMNQMKGMNPNNGGH